LFSDHIENNLANDQERNLEIVQLDIFKIEQGGVLQKMEKIALISLKTH